MDKVHKYAKKYCDGDVIISTLGNSYYYHFNNGKFILRISDHIGRNSDGKVSIIIDKNGYMLHNHTTGAVNIETYESIKKFIRSLAVLSGYNIKFDMVANIELGPLKQEIGKLKQDNNSMLQKIESLQNKNKQLGDKNTQINNENTKIRNERNSYATQLNKLKQNIIEHPLKTWLNLKTE